MSTVTLAGKVATPWSVLVRFTAVSAATGYRSSTRNLPLLATTASVRATLESAASPGTKP